MVRYFVTHHALPPLTLPPHRLDNGDDIANYLSFNDPPYYYAPPLYYALGAVLTFWTPPTDLPDLLVPNPRWRAGYALDANASPVDKTFYAHRYALETFASPTVRALAVLRGLGLLLGLATVLCTHALARELWPDRPRVALAAAAVVALNPQFVALSAGVTNDNLLNALFALFSCWRCAVSGGGQAGNTGRWSVWWRGWRC